MNTPTADDIIADLESRGLGWSLDHTGTLHTEREPQVRCDALVLLVARWRERKADYEAEWKEAAARRYKGGRLAAADIAMEITVCIRELEELLGAGKKENGKLTRCGEESE
jgi:hypothetical protein